MLRREWNSNNDSSYVVNIRHYIVQDFRFEKFYDN